MATRYWVGGAGNWSSTTKWSTSSGGASGASVPTSVDDAVFDANSGGKFTATVDTAQTVNSITITPSAAAGVMTISLTAKLTTNNLTTSGTAGNNRIFFTCTTYGLAIDFAINGTVSISDCDFRGIYVTGTAAPISGTRIGNRGECRGITFGTPKTVYWSQAAGGNWSGNNWAASSGGAPSTDYFPLAQDTVTFVNTGLNTSATVTWDNVITYTGSVDMSGRTNAMTLATGTVAPTVYGNWTNGSGTTLSGTGTITFSGGSTQTITSAGKTFTQPITVNTYGGTVQLGDALNISTNVLVITNGTFDTKNYNITAGYIFSNNTNVRTITLGSSTISLSSSLGIDLFATNLTFNAGTSNITVSVNTTGTGNINGGGQTFYNFTYTNAAATTFTLTINDQNTFNNLTVANSNASANIQIYQFSANQTINGTLTCAGASAIRRIILQSSTFGTQRDLTVGTLAATDCDFRDIEILGAAAGSSPTRAGDCGNNAGITFPSPKTVYWNLAGAQNWSATAWCTGSGGTPALNNFPLAQDTAKFDEAASSVTGTITIDRAWNIGTFDASARTSAMTLTTSTNAPVVYGDWKFGTGVTSSSTTGTITFSKNGTQTITSNGVQFGCPVTVNHPSGTVQLADALSLGATRTLTLTAGTFDAVSYNVTTGLFSNATTLNTLKMGSGTWTLSGIGTVWNCATVPTLIVGTSTIVLSDTSTTSRTFAGGGGYYNKLTIGGTTGTSILVITGSNNTIGEIASTKTVAHTIQFASSTTHTFGKWSVTGTAGNVVTLSPQTAALSYTIAIAGPANSGIDYLSVSYCAVSTASPGEFYVGVNSTNTAGNTGAIIFTAAPTPRTLYWVGGTGNWSSTTSWSTASGGASGAAIPTSLDAVNFDSASNATAYTATIDAGVTIARCASFTMAGPASGSVTFAGTVSFAFHGSVSFAATGIIRTYNGLILLGGNSSYTFTTNGLALSSTVYVYGTQSTWTLGSALDIGSVTFYVQYGTFSTSASNYSLSAGSLNINFTSVRSASLNASTITLVSGVTITTTTNLTWNAGTSQINISGSTPAITSAGLTFNNVSFTNTVASGITISGTNTFNNLTFTGRISVGINIVTISANQTISGTLTLGAGTASAYRTSLVSNSFNTTRTLTVNSLAAGAADIDFRDITIAGAAAPISGTRFGDVKGNSGITFPAAKTVYYRNTGSNSWGTAGAGSWSATSGAAADGAMFPLAQDTAVFPAATYPASGSTTTINTYYNIGTVDMSLRTTNTMTLATSIYDLYVVGNWINGTGTAISGTGFLFFAGRGTQTITSAGKTFTQPFSITTPSGSITLQDALTINSASSGLTLNSGTFDAATYNVSLLSTTNFQAAGTAAKTLAIGSGTWSVAASGVSAWNTGGSNITVTGTGKISLTSASTKTFTGNNLSYASVTLDQGGAGTLTITGNNTFKDITSTYTATGATSISLGSTTQTLAQFTGAGASGKVLTLSGTSAVLILTSGTVTTADYLSITSIRAYSLSSTWYAGANSTNGSSLGWYFQAYSPGGAYTITANNGTYSLTGQTATLLRSKQLDANSGSYTLTGQTATLLKTKYITASNGSYTLTGQSAILIKGVVYTITASNGTYSLTGQSSTLLRSKQLSANNGSYSVTGQTANLIKGRVLQPSYGSYTVTGRSADLVKGRVLQPSYGAYSVSGQTANLVKGRVLQPSYGSYSVSGQSATLLKTKYVAASSGSYTVNGQSATLLKTKYITASNGSYTVTGRSADLVKGRVLQPSYGAYSVSGQTATLTKGKALQAAYGTYSVAGQAATLTKGKVMQLSYGAYAVTGQNATIALGKLWNLIPTDQPAAWSSFNTSYGAWSIIDNSQSSGWVDIATTYSVASPLSAAQVGSVWVPYTTPLLVTGLTPSRLKTIEGIYYAVGDTTISKSVNGAVWTYAPATILGANTIADIAYSNGLWVVVGTNGAIATSTDFQTWTTRTSGTTTDLGAVQFVSLPSFSGFIAAGSMTVLYSQDGVSWVSATNPMVSLQRPRDIVTIAGRVLICSGYSDFAFYTRVQVISSTDGANWSTSLDYTNTALSLIPAVSAAYDPSTGRVYVISRGNAAKAQISYTSDGVNWSTFNSTTSFTGLYFYGAAFSTSGVFVVANRTASLRYSLDYGVTWTTAQSSLGGSIPGSGRGVAYNEFEGGYGFIGSSQNIYVWLSQTTTPVWGTFPTVSNPSWGLVS